ncbi:hypothetical protein Dvina_32525 [Dactylosporangium vinaceum]|uniref:Integral membrane protein n=1 Tax=Dactylosporangium vinaceum TaxID=53362 RepID=A0ABV5MAE1_9ACTN|nr:hypothetical protein [Dactylosporangium vinaceum]UAB93015.1 hypothetical protein Dvina_32525 [Dactylosporangium vinaceum]
MAIVGTASYRPVWARRGTAAAGAVIAVAVVVAVVRLPVRDAAVWAESLTVAVSAVGLVAVTWWLTGRADPRDRQVVLTWGLGSGLVLGGLWIAEIAFNNLTPHSVSTAGARGVLDNLTWAVVGVGTVAAAGGVAARTGRWRSGLRAGVWSGVGSGLGAALGGAVLLACFRSFVEADPLMRDEWRLRDGGVDLSLYVTRETMAGVGGHLWVLGVGQGAVLGLLASSVVIAATRYRPRRATPEAA